MYMLQQLTPVAFDLHLYQKGPHVLCGGCDTELKASSGCAADGPVPEAVPIAVPLSPKPSRTAPHQGEWKSTRQLVVVWAIHML